MTLFKVSWSKSSFSDALTLYDSSFQYPVVFPHLCGFTTQTHHLSFLPALNATCSCLSELLGNSCFTVTAIKLRSSSVFTFSVGAAGLNRQHRSDSEICSSMSPYNLNTVSRCVRMQMCCEIMFTFSDLCVCLLCVFQVSYGARTLWRYTLKTLRSTFLAPRWSSVGSGRKRNERILSPT